MGCYGLCLSIRGAHKRPLYRGRVYCSVCGVSFPEKEAVRKKRILYCPCCHSRVRVKRRWFSHTRERKRLSEAPIEQAAQ